MVDIVWLIVIIWAHLMWTGWVGSTLDYYGLATFFFSTQSVYIILLCWWPLIHSGIHPSILQFVRLPIHYFIHPSIYHPSIHTFTNVKTLPSHPFFNSFITHLSKHVFMYSFIQPCIYDLFIHLINYPLFHPSIQSFTYIFFHFSQLPI